MLFMATVTRGDRRFRREGRWGKCSSTQQCWYVEVGRFKAAQSGQESKLSNHFFFFFSNFKRHIFYQEFNNQWWIVTFLKTAHGVSRLPIFVWWVVVMIYHGYRRYLYIQQHVRLHLPSVKWDGKQQVLVSSDRLEFSSSVVYFRAVHLFFPVVYTISWKVWPVTATNKAIKILGGGAANISKGSDSLFHLGPHNPLHINPAHIFRFAGKHSGHY